MVVVGRWIKGEKVRLELRQVNTKLMVLLEMVEGSVVRRADAMDIIK